MVAAALWVIEMPSKTFSTEDELLEELEKGLSDTEGVKTLFLLVVLFIFCVPTVQGEIYELLGNLITFLINAASLQSYILPLYPDRQLEITIQKRFDFIVVGSGPSGSVVANRLTENPNVSVLLLENGEEATSISEVSALAGYFGMSKYNYGYKTEPQPGFCRGCTDKRLNWEHGKALGGSTVINYMMYVRGNRGDYDKWAALGNPGWAYDDLLPYFKKIEDCHVKINDSGYHGTGGYLSVTDVEWRTKISEIYVKAAQEAGHPYVDYNGKQQLGVSYVQATTRDGRRGSAERSYLRPIRTRRNLIIETRALVTKILIHPENKTAYGVEYIHNGIKHQVCADKEVILSAGALNSPQVLMLSGIGPKDELSKFGIPLIADLPVGKKIYDHANFPLIMYQVNESVTINAIREFSDPLNYLGLLVGKGFFSSLGGVETVTFIKTNMSTDPDPLYPDIELQMMGGSIASDYGVINRNMYNIPPAIYNTVFKPLEGKYVYQVTPILAHPKSYGTVTLRSRNPSDAPVFHANFLSDPENHDVKTFIAGIRAFQKINESPSLQKVGATIVSIPVPGCEQETFNSDQYWECALRTVIGSYFHMVSTCKMGPATDKEAVVDHELKVHGLQRFRVVDTSVIPVLPASHNMAPGYVIGEKAADLLKQSWNI